MGAPRSLSRVQYFSVPLWNMPSCHKSFPAFPPLSSLSENPRILGFPLRHSLLPTHQPQYWPKIPLLGTVNCARAGQLNQPTAVECVTYSRFQSIPTGLLRDLFDSTELIAELTSLIQWTCSSEIYYAKQQGSYHCYQLSKYLRHLG